MSADLLEHLRRRILILDGSMGVLLQKRVRTEEGYRGERFRNHPRDLRNNTEALLLHAPELVKEVHEAYLAAGADIVETSTFTANAIAQEDYGLEAYVREMNLVAARIADVPLIVYPNAGLPNPLAETGYDMGPDTMAALIEPWARDGWLNIVGGCCGTTPEHISAIARAVAGHSPRTTPTVPRLTRLAGTEPLVVRPETNFVNIGERCNVAGSRRFLRMIERNDFEGAITVARDQVRSGAQILDICFDDRGMLDRHACMGKFLTLLQGEPDINRVPWMIDSSDFSVIETGLRATVGKPIVNSISLKSGEDDFRSKAGLARRYGAAVVVMAFDEKGQADTADRKTEICERSYRILVDELGFPPEDIVFDPNVLAIGTGIEEHRRYAIDFFEATKWIKANLPHCHVSGGVSNVSFAFAGNDVVRAAMHTVFLNHAVSHGMDMGIVHAGQLGVYDDIALELREAIEDLIFDRRDDATDRLMEVAQRHRGAGIESAEVFEDWRALPVGDRLGHALLKGLDTHIEADTLESLAELGSPLHVIEGPLMAGMNHVGDLFGAGRLFLPQVVKSARVMKRAVKVLTPYLEAEKVAGSSAGKILLATVRGDVHDIGKNIVGVVLSCNGYEIIDLGVMVSAERILAAAREHAVDMIGLSGLITPSLDEMIHVAGEMERQEFRIPLLIGGATTSRLHTAVMIAPKYSGGVVHVIDASRAVPVAAELVSEARKDQWLRDYRREQDAMRADWESRREKVDLLRFDEARANRKVVDWASYTPPPAPFFGAKHLSEIPLDTLVPYIDWGPFFIAWDLHGGYPGILDDPTVGEAARNLHRDAMAMLDRIVDEQWIQARGTYGYWPATSDGESVRIRTEAGPVEWIFLRQQTRKRDGLPNRCLADYVAPDGAGYEDLVGAFAVTTGHGVRERVEALRKNGDDYSAIMVEALADRLAEAFAEYLHRRVRIELGFEKDGPFDNEILIQERYRGIRPAPGYPACPEHREKALLFEMMGAHGGAGMSLTESFMMDPASSVCGYYLFHPEARYFAVGKVGRDQIESYSQRRGETIAASEKWLAPNLAYDPASM